MKLHREGKHEEAHKRMEEMKKRFIAERSGHHQEHQDKNPGEKPPGRNEAHDRPHQAPPGHPDAQARVAHLREAAEHLRAAGLTREAEQLRAKADEAQRANDSRQAAPTGMRPDIDRRIEALEKSVQNLAKQLEAVGAELKRRGS